MANPHTDRGKQIEQRTRSNLTDQDKSSQSGCQSVKDEAKQFICQHQDLTERFKELDKQHAYTLKLAPRSVVKKLKKMHHTWQKEWVATCSLKSGNQPFDISCVTKQLDMRLVQLKKMTRVESLLIVPDSIHKTTESEFHGPADRVVTYDQLYTRRGSHILTKRSVRFLNKRLQPSKWHKDKLNDDEAIYYANITFVYSVEHLFGIREWVSEWCVGCNGADSSYESFAWYFKKDLKPLKPSHLFGGPKWRSKLAKVFRDGLDRCSHGHGYQPKDGMRAMSGHTGNWRFEPKGFSFEFHLAYYHSERCLITWEDIRSSGITIKLKPRVCLSNLIST